MRVRPQRILRLRYKFVLLWVRREGQHEDTAVGAEAGGRRHFAYVVGEDEVT